MIIQIGTCVDESRILWKHKESDKWQRADIDDLIEAYEGRQTGWIPVSERLPEIGQKVLASTKRTMFTQVYKGIYSEPNVWHWEHNSIKVVTAWMPLPPVYQGE